MYSDKELVIKAFDSIDVHKLIDEDNLKLSEIIDLANKYFKENEMNLTLGTGNYKSLKRLIKLHYGYELLKGRNKTSNWKRTKEPLKSYTPALYRNNPPKIETKIESEEINNLLDTTKDSNDVMQNCLNTILKTIGEIQSEIRTLKNTPRNLGGTYNTSKDLISTVLNLYGNDMIILKKVIIPKKLDDELSKIVYDRYEISRNDPDYFTQVLLLAMLLLSKP